MVHLNERYFFVHVETAALLALFLLMNGFDSAKSFELGFDDASGGLHRMLDDSDLDLPKLAPIYAARGDANNDNDGMYRGRPMRRLLKPPPLKRFVYDLSGAAGALTAVDGISQGGGAGSRRRLSSSGGFWPRELQPPPFV